MEPNMNARLNRLPLALLAIAAAVAFLSGCQESAPTTQPSSAYDRSEHALQDPMHYRPTFDRTDTDIGGGGIGHYDKQGMQRDLNDVFNP